IAQYTLQPKRPAKNKKGRYYYQRLHETNSGYKENNWLLPEINAIVEAGVGHIVELGCGNGHFLRAASKVVDRVTGIDFAVSPLLDNLPPNVEFHQLDVVADKLPGGDLACSADVLEQIAEEDIAKAIGNIRRTAPLQYHLVACYDDGHSHET